MIDTIIRAVTPGDEAALAAMFAGLSERDLTVIREDLTGPTAGIADGPGSGGSRPRRTEPSTDTQR
ncbi:hypothetical protein [Tsukamurella sp. PLM1]|uniref:hypothetical protein n=1 Tax=Tsukamurella sp. PLM1 TaxID=2929795 RepID=UPI00205E1D2E|nr:hypothetical protein [Tsukamurella sp. PLM1]BDH57445.1 hypothetical protein MTP03_23840 [Tsukamurella sp. PLM1]